jgi:hypothetical protein
VFFWLAAGAANAASMPADYSEESPKVRELLTQADVLAGELDDPANWTIPIKAGAWPNCIARLPGWAAPKHSIV